MKHFAVLPFPLICCWGIFNFNVKREEGEEEREKVWEWHEKAGLKETERQREGESEGVGLREDHRSALWPQSNLEEALDRHVVAIWPGLPCYYTSWFILKCYLDYTAMADLALVLFMAQAGLTLASSVIHKKDCVFTYCVWFEFYWLYKSKQFSSFWFTSN